MRTLVMIVLLAACCAGVLNAGTLVYSYDEQHRLAGVNYDNEATARYEYDKADNMTGFTVLTDSQYFKPFMLYFSKLRDTIRGWFGRDIDRVT